MFTGVWNSRICKFVRTDDSLTLVRMREDVAVQFLHDRNVLDDEVDERADFLDLRQRVGVFITELRDVRLYTRGRAYTYFVEQFLQLLVLRYLEVHVLQETSAKGAAGTSTLKKITLELLHVGR